MIVLGACDLLPRGAGLQTEVLAASRNDEGQKVTDFSIEPVTRENLVTYLRWAPASSDHFHWINRVDQPNSRIIRAGDTLDITVWTTNIDGGLLTAPGQRSVELAGNRVSSNGTIFLPYLGDCLLYTSPSPRDRG